KSNLNYRNEEFSRGIYNLVLKKIIFSGKKITIKNILNNNKRSRILEFINQNPGAHLREIRKKLNLTPHITNWHLTVLKDFEFIYEFKYLKYKNFFPFNYKKGMEKPLLVLKNKNAVIIFKNIYSNPDLDLENIKSLCGLSSKIINYHFNNILSSKLIIPYEVQGKQYYKIDVNKLNYINQFLNLPLDEEIRQQKLAKITASQEIIAIQDEIHGKPSEIIVPDIQKLPKPTPITVVPKTSELIKIRREYDYVGGGIRFKIAVQNISDKVITDINLMLIPTAQYEISERVKIVGVLKPDESRGVDFDLIPLTCGKSKVFGSCSFIDAFGNPHTLTVPSKEIWIKCPLVKPKKSTLDEIENIKRHLQKGSAEISFKINKKSAFNIVIDQISALDLSEIVIIDNEFKAIYSGIAKVTNENLIIESRISNHNAILTVWTSNMKQATGFLAYLKNLVRMAFDSASKIEDKTERVSQKILDSSEIIQRLFTLFDYCEGSWTISDIIILLKEIKIKLNRSIPGLIITEQLEDFIEEFQRDYREGEPVSKKISINLQFQVINWLKEINKIACSNLETFRQTFPEKDGKIQKICSIIDEKTPQIDALKEKYISKILHYLMIFDRKSGLTVFEHNFTESSLDPDLLSGFLTAIQSFGAEISQEETSVTKLAYKNFEIILDEKGKVRGALILNGSPLNKVLKKLNEFISKFELKFREILNNWTGDVGLFGSANELIKKIFL
ncbi:MAG: hypothetical protein ACTSR3_22630, partial [Candidatus Helarchaeota archaeon]